MTWLAWVGIAFWIFVGLAFAGYRYADRPGDDFGRAAWFALALVIAFVLAIVWIVGKALS